LLCKYCGIYFCKPEFTFSIDPFFVVSAFIIGGCIIGTRAIYEYAAIAIGPKRCGASLEVTKIAVGPSAPPMIPIAPAS